ncbi:MAG: 2-oxoacid ferredoxin oxidoreductase [Candidatus Omnitrophica bacterium]|nr:2-oxoacid ferredoxin oxidoreductase [Candidatus Omnitrophota bacterium]
MAKTIYDFPEAEISWCPGCGNFGILTFLKDVLAEVAPDPQKLVLVSGIGQAAKLPQYVKGHYFNGLHGRALPPATAIKVSNPSLTVVVTSGDGDMYGEGGNHFIHTIRRNPDITVIVHNNMVYGLTKGQASPTSSRGFKTPVQANGVILEPFNPLAVAIALDASFVARIFMGFKDHSEEVLKKAILHKGFSLVDVFQPCVTYNKLNTYQWFREKTYFLDSSHDPKNRAQAFQKAIETDKFPLGIFYQQTEKPVFEDQLVAYRDDKTPLFERKPNLDRVQAIMHKLRQ